jgi:hypothetical protein
MLRLEHDTIEKAQRHLERVKIFTVEQAASTLGCSISNTRLKIKKWGTYTSYNCNGRFYTLSKVPVFDRNDLWRHDIAAFSKHGNLKKTVVHLVISSQGGLTGRQLGELLGLSPQSFMHHVSHYSGIRRQKHEGVFVYFSDDDSVYAKQLRHRTSNTQSDCGAISEGEAIMILVAVVKRHGITAEEIAELPEIRKSNMKLANIRSFLRLHGLEKKIPDSRR